MKKLFSQALDFAKKKPLAALGIIFALAIIGSFAMVQAEKYPTLACSPCHVMDPYTVGYFEGELLSNRHQKANVNCIDCHENGIEDKIHETIWYVTDDFDDPPHKRDFGNQMCTKCHDNIEELIAKTDKGNGINPHDSHLGELNCADCHKMHTKSVAACQNCHDFEFLASLPSEWKKIELPKE